MRYLAIGDGMCSGRGAPFMSPNCIQQHARLAEGSLNERVNVTTIARTNYRSNDIVSLLEDEYVMNRIEESDMILLSAGHQDFIDAVETYQEDQKEEAFQEALKISIRNVDDIIYKIKDLKKEKNDPYMLTILGLHNPYREHPRAKKWIKHYNDHLECKTRAPQMNAVNLHHYFKENLENLCTKDFFYPNHRGHEEIAKLLHEIGYGPILKENF